jgi:hypothetical protein
MMQPVSEEFMRAAILKMPPEYDDLRRTYISVLDAAEVFRSAKFDECENDVGLTPYIMYNTVNESFVITSRERMEKRYH